MITVQATGQNKQQRQHRLVTTALVAMPQGNVTCTTNWGDFVNNILDSEFTWYQNCGHQTRTMVDAAAGWMLHIITATSKIIVDICIAVNMHRSQYDGG